MKIRRSAPAVLVTATVVVIAAAFATSNQLFAGIAEETEQGQYALMQSIVETSLATAETRALSRAAIVAEHPRTRALLAARDREGMLREYAGVFRDQHDQYGAEQMQFHLPPATSFLRLHAPEHHSDDLSSFRPLVVDANQARAIRRGMSISRDGPGIFAVVPIHDDAGAHLGTFEVALDAGLVLDEIKTAYGLELTFFVLEAPLREVATGMPPETFGDENRLGRYLKVHSTNWQLMRQLVAGDDLGHVDEPVRYAREAGGVVHGVLLLPVRNPTGAPLGVIAASRDFTATRGAAGRSLVWQSLIALVAIVLLVGAILIVIRGAILAPLARITTRYGDLARGDRDRAIEDPDALPDEMRDLARHHETLRSREGG